MFTVDIRELFTESYKKFRGQNLSRFWRDVVPDTDIVQLSEEDLVAVQEDAVVSAYWDHRAPSAEPGPSRTRPPDSEDPLPAPPPNKVHLVVRPLGSEKPLRSVTLNSRGDESTLMIEEETTLIEEESQCSVLLYENGTGPLSASGSDVVSATSPPPGEEGAPSCEPNFRNCLLAGNKSVDDISRRTPVDNSLCSVPLLSTEAVPSPGPSPIESPRLVEENPTMDGEFFPSEDLAIVLETGSKDQVDVVPVPPEETPSQAEANVERKVVIPKNKLPIAVLKPDNPRAVRYWLDQRKAARCPTEKKPPVDEDEPVGGGQSEEFELFHVGLEQGVHDALGQRVLQVLQVLSPHRREKVIGFGLGSQRHSQFEFRRCQFGRVGSKRRLHATSSSGCSRQVVLSTATGLRCPIQCRIRGMKYSGRHVGVIA